MSIRLTSETGPTPEPYDWNNPDADTRVDSPDSSPEIPIAELPTPPTAWLPGNEMKVFGSTPLEQEVATVRCQHCQKPILASAITDHTENCTKSRAGTAKTSGKGATKGGGTTPKGKKRKADDEPGVDGDSSPKKKKSKKDATTGGAKGPPKGRVKGPVDVEKQCGVINDKGLPCSRSITCKVHSMLAKRSVPGRSKPYDELILDWKRANIPGFVEPVKRQTKAEKKEQKDREREEKRKMLEAAGVVVGKNAGGKRGAAAAAKKLAAQAALEDQEEMEMDSDVEVESLVRALKSSPVVPMATPDNMGNFFIERNERLRCCGDIMLAALTRGNGGAGFSHGHVGGTFPID